MATPHSEHRLGELDDGVDSGCEIGERARGSRDALVTGAAEAAEFIRRIATDGVVEGEIAHAAAGNAERCGEMGVRELWRLDGRVTALNPDRAPASVRERAGARGASLAVLRGILDQGRCRAPEPGDDVPPPTNETGVRREDEARVSS